MEYFMKYWQQDRKLTIEKEIQRELDYEARLIIGEMVHSGFLLRDIKIHELSRDYICGLLDALYKSKRDIIK